LVNTNKACQCGDHMKKIILLVLCLGLLACSDQDPQSPEQRVKATLVAIEEAAEARSLSGIMRHVSGNYRDHQGRLSDDVKRTIQIYLLSNQQIHIFTRINSLEITGDLASVELLAAMASTEAALMNEEQRIRADTHRFSLLLVLEDDEWLLSSASWQRGW